MGDWDVLQRTLSPDLLTNFVVYVLTKVMELEAPVHVQETKKSMDQICEKMSTDFRPEFVVEAFKLVMSKLRQLQEEVDKYRRGIARLHLQKEAVSCQQQYVSKALAMGQMHFTKTRRWLERTLSAHFPNHKQRRASQECDAVVREALMDLLQAPMALNTFTTPETLIMDIENLVNLQNSVQHITLTACVVNILSTLCAQKRLSLSRQELAETKSKVDQLLKKKDVNLPLITSTSTDLLKELMATPSRSSHPGSKVTIEDIDLLKSMLQKTSDTNDPVYMTFRSKVLAAISAHCRTPAPDPSTVLLPSSNLSIVDQDVRIVGGYVRRLFLNNVAVFGKYYYNMVLGMVAHCVDGADDDTLAEDAPIPSENEVNCTTEIDEL
eukprot:NODE_1049_length_1299_cov_83.715200_g864_i0.p1 GENE.NODE_1049_length_1299_cov_83.715200_g864_i0~~NODE_1049_length_1299_cov_83.715200_g864_i0.p1  ORF type:complete len:389 (+),score=132.30 NODE_1049_length_1299_cov_83.715200_g864_i0:27-1169(+)